MKPLIAASSATVFHMQYAVCMGFIEAEGVLNYTPVPFFRTPSEDLF